MAAEMISVSEARKIIFQCAAVLPPIKLSINQAAGLVLAEDIYATISIPAYTQSAMDGYAFSFEGWKKTRKLKIEGEMAAGSKEIIALAPNTTWRIFTGAPLPGGADTVVMQEKVKVENNHLDIQDENILQGANTRSKGSEIKVGELALAEDTLLVPAAIGFLAGIGITEVLVYPLPSISIIVTGNELQKPGNELLQGQVYESNSFSLKAALKQLGIFEVQVFNAEDELEIVKEVLEKALKQSDIVFLTGGVSVGDYDFVAKAAAQNHIEKQFHKIKQRPGKPFYFGTKGNKLVFGLPGNPASVLTCFYEYIEPAIKRVSKQRTTIQVIQAPLTALWKKAPGLTHFLKGFYDGTKVTVLQGQESYRLSSFANANCLIKLDEEVAECTKGQLVEIHLLPA